MTHADAQHQTQVTTTNRIENLHVLVWLMKDFSWCSSWHWLGIICIAPTLVVAAKIAFDSRKSIPDLVHNVAVVLWICANITWMVGEFFYEDHTRSYAKAFFFSGMLLLGGYYVHTVHRKAKAWFSAA